jgi:S-methylmethionine-dependent homocysteine/selenocysteine methylase
MWLNKPLMLLDGATGTELGRRGVDISLPLWSAHAILEAPAVLAEIHRDYLLAGSDIITANTFRTHRRSLHKVGMGDRARELTQRAVDIALEARDRYKPDAIVVGSVAPLEDCYKPELAPDAGTCEAEHGEMIATLIDAGVDGILIETQNNLHEAEAAANQARKLARDRWMISFITTHEGPPGMLLSGESLADLLPALSDAASIGVNCTAAPSTEAQVKLLRLLLPHHMRISAYANVSKACADGTWHSTDAVDPEVYADYAARWIAAGASIIGGCCGTRPQMIQAIARRLGQNMQLTA